MISPPAFLKELGDNGRKELLRIFNQSFNSGKCPGMWLVATIIPLLKAKKPASDLASYRPISLTSCVVENGGKSPLSSRGKKWKD